MSRLDYFYVEVEPSWRSPLTFEKFTVTVTTSGEVVPETRTVDVWIAAAYEKFGHRAEGRYISCSTVQERTGNRILRLVLNHLEARGIQVPNRYDVTVSPVAQIGIYGKDGKVC